jgi:hypothetical protein
MRMLWADRIEETQNQAGVYKSDAEKQRAIESTNREW